MKGIKVDYHDYQYPLYLYIANYNMFMVGIQ